MGQYVLSLFTTFDLKIIILSMSVSRFTKALLFLAVLLFNASLFAQEVPYLKYLNHPWVDSVLMTLDEEERIAQSIWMAAWSNRDVSHSYEISKLISENKIGGLIFFQGTAEKEAELINHYQSLSEVPLIIAMDAEWGPGMRLDNIVDFPFQMTLGAIKNDSLIYNMGLDVARQMRVIGLNQNLAPVADINNNPKNPVINFRSFGENREKVTNKVVMYSRGLQDGGIIATAKHFPGHGDTDSDSHHMLPVINHSKLRFDTLELVPFKHLISAGVGSIMSAHLHIPSFDSLANLPSTLSENIIKGLLKDQMGYQGIVVTDAMNMKGITSAYESGVADAMAYMAGNDVLEYVQDAEKAINSIKKYREQGKITDKDIESKCRKILAMKYWCGLNNFQLIEGDDLEESVNLPQTLALIRELYAEAITVLRNDNNILPLKNIEDKKIATLSINGPKENPFTDMVSNYTDVDRFSWNMGDNNTDLLSSLSDYDLVLTIITDTDQRPYRNFGISDEQISFISELVNNNNNTITVYTGNPYAISMLSPLKHTDGLVLTYQENKMTQELAAQLIFGGIGAHGKLPVTINKDYPEGFGIITPGNIRLQYGYPENAGLSSVILERGIDSIVYAGLTAEAFPGCEVIAARKGIVVFHKTYGYHTFYKRIKVDKNDIYDLASLTKASAATAGLMVLDDMKLFDPDENLGTYFPDFKRSNKSDLIMRDILAHQAGLAAWIPYWKDMVKENGEFKCGTVKTLESARYNVELSDGLYLHKNYRKKIYKQIKKSPLGDNKYLYSGLSFYLYPQIIEDASGNSFENFLKANIYKPLGANNITFNAHQDYPLVQIVPTELDDFFRNTQIHGYVHDEGAAMMGGVSGNAGLFSTANDLLKLYEMYRRYGLYGGEQIISEETLRRYSDYQFADNNNRRGLGFDKPSLPDTTLNSSQVYPCSSASASSFGHSGYTGTFAWADPDNEISYVFLSNRVYPTRENNKISMMNIRTEILQTIYDSIID
jgi:beta-N-acetylhexosaminidase